MTPPTVTSPVSAPGGVRLRDLAWTDIDTLAALERDIFGAHAWSAASWWSELAQRPRRDYLVAVSADGAIAGYGGLDLGGETADIMTVAVVPAARGTGLGTALVAELRRRAVHHGARDLMLEVRADNPAALALYEAAGFEPIHVRRGYYRPEGVDAVIMRCRLDRPGRPDGLGTGDAGGPGREGGTGGDPGDGREATRKESSR